MTTTLSPAAQTGVQIWDRIWRDAPDAAKDRAQLDREEQSDRWRRLATFLNDRFGRIQGLRTVELGAGRGDVSVLLAQRGADVTLVDYSDCALENARRRFEALNLTAKYVRGDLVGDLSHLRGRFDVSLSVGVVEHFRHSQRTTAINAHAVVLRNGGAAMVSVPNAWCAPYRAWKAYLQLRGWWPYGLEIPYSRRELSRRARKAGLTPVEIFAEGWRRSVCEHWGRGVFHRHWPQAMRRSWLDRWGYDLSLIAVRHE